MKFRLASLLFLLSGTAFINSPALSMQEDDFYDDFVGGSRSFGHPDDSEKGSSDDSRSSYITDEQDPRVELDEFLSKQNYPRAFRSMNESGNKASDEELVRFLLTSNGFTKWSRLSPLEKARVVGRIAYEADRDGLEELLNRQNYPRAFRSMKESGNKASNEEIVGYLLTSNGYKRWPLLSSDKRSWVVDRITTEEEVDHLREFLSGLNFPHAFRSMKESGNKASDEEIAEYLITSNKYERWETLGQATRRMAFDHIIEGEDRRELQELLRAQDFSSAFHALKASENPASDEEIVKFLLTSNGYTKWEKISKSLRAAVKHSITGKDLQEALYLFHDRVDFWKAYHLLKGSKVLSLDEGVVRLILEQKGFKFWDELSPNLRPLLVSHLSRGYVSQFPEPVDVDAMLDEERAAVAQKVEKLFTEEMDWYEKSSIIDTAQRIDDEADVSPRVAAIVKYQDVLFPESMRVNNRVYCIEYLLQYDAKQITMAAQGAKLLPSPDSYEYRSILELLMKSDPAHVQLVAQNADIFSFMTFGTLQKLMELDVDKILVVAEAVKVLLPKEMEEYYWKDLIEIFLESNLTALQILAQNKEVFFDDEISDYDLRQLITSILETDATRIRALVENKNLFPESMEADLRANCIEILLQYDAKQITMAAQGAKLLPSPDSYGYLSILELLMKSDPARVQLVAQNADIFSFMTFGTLQKLMELDVDKILVVAEAVKVLLPKEMEEFSRNLLIGVLIESDLTALQILAQNKEVFFDNDIHEYDLRQLITSILKTDATRIRSLVENKDAFFSSSMKSDVRLKLVSKILSLPPEEIGLTATALKRNSALLFVPDMEDEARARIIEAAVQCGVDKLDARLVALEENAGTLLKDMKGRGRAEMIITALNIEAGEIASRAAAIERNKEVYFTEETENADLLTLVTLLNTDASKIDVLALIIAELLPVTIDRYTRANGISTLLRADIDRVRALVKYKNLLFKNSYGIHLIMEEALKVSDEELSRRVIAIGKALSPDSILSRRMGEVKIEYLYNSIVIALLKKSVEETDACMQAIERNAVTFLRTPFDNSLQDQSDIINIMASLIKLSSEEIDRRAESIKKYTKVLFPEEISVYDRVGIMKAVIEVSGDKLDEVVPIIAEAYTHVEKSADSEARAQVIIDNLPRSFYWW